MQTYQNRNNKKQNKTAIQNKVKKNKRRNNSSRDQMLTIPRGCQAVVPDRLRTRLRFWKSVSINLTVSTVASTRFQPSAAFDLDPTIGSAAAVGFTQLAALYNSYRVRSSSAWAETVNTGTVPIITILLPTNVDPGASPSSAYVISSRQQPYAVSETGALVGGPVSRLHNTMSTKKIYGSKMTDVDDNFASLVTSVPNNNWYWVINHYCLAVSPSAIIMNFYMEIEVDFYDRAFLTA